MYISNSLSLSLSLSLSVINDQRREASIAVLPTTILGFPAHTGGLVLLLIASVVEIVRRNIARSVGVTIGGGGGAGGSGREGGAKRVQALTVCVLAVLMTPYYVFRTLFMNVRGE